MISKPPLRVVFMGTPDFAVPSLRILLEHPEVCRVVAVYTQPDRPSGRGLKMKSPPVKVLAQQNGIPVYQPEDINKNEEPRRLADSMSDLCVVVAYAQFLGKAVLNTPRLGCINVHASLLPKYRGAAPIQYALLNGDQESGVTIIRLIPKMDAGPILMQESLPITTDDGAAVLFEKLSHLGAQTLLKTLIALQSNKIIERPQNEEEVTYAPAITKEMGLIDWSQGAQAVVNKVRALDLWPVAYANSSIGRVKVLIAKLCPATPYGCAPYAVPGDHHILKDELFVKTRDHWVRLDMLQQEGKKPVKAKDFINGIQNLKEPFRFT